MEEEMMGDALELSDAEKAKKEDRKQVWGASILFLALVVIHISASFIDFKNVPTWGSILISQGLIIIPVAVYFIIMKKNPLTLIRFRMPHIGTLFLMIPMFMFLQPLFLAINAISMSFATNVMAGAMTDIAVAMPYAAGVALLAVLPAIVEETTFRGIILNSYHRDSNPWPGIIFSALCFGAMHMNFNQIAYATVLGLFMGFIIEASGSIIPTMLLHLIFNGFSTTMMYVLPVLMKMSQTTLTESGMSDQEIQQMVGQSVNTVSGSQMLGVGMAVLPFGIVGGAIAFLLIVLIAKINHRDKYFLGMFKKKTPEQKIAIKADKLKVSNAFLWIALGLCVAMAITTEILIRTASAAAA